WYVDPQGPSVKGGPPLSPKEIDMVITWASGGTPQGDLTKKPAPVVARAQWRSGTPDLKLDMESEHTLPAGTSEETFHFALATNVTETKWVKATDLLPGTPSIVRDALIAIDNGPTLAMWVPGTDPVVAPSGAAFKLSPGAKLHVQIHYKKSWQDEQNAKSDKSSVGLYFTDPPASGRELPGVDITGPPSDSPQPGAS